MKGLMPMGNAELEQLINLSLKKIEIKAGNLPNLKELFFAIWTPPHDRTAIRIAQTDSYRSIKISGSMDSWIPLDPDRLWSDAPTRLAGAARPLSDTFSPLWFGMPAGFADHY